MVSFIIFFSIRTYSQNSCIKNLEEAEELYEMGQIDKIESLLNPCLENGFTKEEKVKAYRLLILSNLYYNEDEKAKESMKKLLKVKPEYKIKEFDPAEFISLHNSFRTIPVFIAGIKGSIGGMGMYDLNNYNDINSFNYTATYHPDISYSFGLSFETPIIPDLSLVYEFYYNSCYYNYDNRVLNYADIHFEEKISGIDIPVLVQWNILKGDFSPYVNIGSAFNYLLSSNVKHTRVDDENSSDEYRDPVNLNLDMTHARNKYNFSLSAGLGFRWKNILGNGYLTFDIRYSRYFENIVSPDQRADSPEMVYSGLTTDNTFKIQTTQVFIGYKLPIYIAKYKGKKHH
jgi:opacity protein-like surface antigen